MNNDNIELETKYNFPIQNKNEKFQDFIKRCHNYTCSTLGLKLSKNEINILISYNAEKKMNLAISKIYNKCNKHNLYIPKLSVLDGNCLFDSLLYVLNINEKTNIINIRYGIASLMNMYKKFKNFFPCEEKSMEEIFDILNTGDCKVEYVLQTNNKKENEIKRYTFDAMCQDLATDGSWSRLPTQLILMVISFIFKLKIKIITDAFDDYMPHTNVWENTDIPQDQINTIYLGHIQEYHYIPIIQNNNEYRRPIYYNEAIIKYENMKKIIEEAIYKKINININL